jgi:ABC-2 type transport system ATP-binding protein
MTMSEAGDFAVEMVDVTKRFGRQTAVRDLSFRVPKGTAFGFLGPNGAGKTTTLKLLVGLLGRDAGQVRVLGLDPAAESLKVRQRVGYVPQQQFIYRWMCVEEAIGFCRKIFPVWNDALCRQLLNLFVLDPKKKVGHLSEGMLVKLALLLALSHEPEVLVLDEPMAGLDPLAREEFLDGVLRSVCDRGQTLLFSSHTLPDIQRMADRIAIIDEGELLVDSQADELLRETKRIHVILSDGCGPPEPPEGVVYQRVNNREWLITVRDFSTDTVEQIRARNRVASVEVIDLALEDIFKDYIRGRRERS